jgi:hypothetical protein
MSALPVNRDIFYYSIPLSIGTGTPREYRKVTREKEDFRNYVSGRGAGWPTSPGAYLEWELPAEYLYGREPVGGVLPQMLWQVSGLSQGQDVLLLSL